MSLKTRLIAGVVLITLICFIDYQYFSEGMDVRKMNPLYRQVGHLAILMCTAAIGYWAWKKHPFSWTGSLWLIAYTAAIVVITIIGLAQWQTGFFSKNFLDRVSDARLFFGSPLPFFILYMLTIIARRVH